MKTSIETQNQFELQFQLSLATGVTQVTGIGFVFFSHLITMRNACKMFIHYTIAHDPCKAFKLFLDRVDWIYLRLVSLSHPLSRYKCSFVCYGELESNVAKPNVVDVVGQWNSQSLIFLTERKRHVPKPLF